METILCIDTPVQMISCTDTDGKITPMRFRFRDRNGELITINIEKIVSADQERSSLRQTLSVQHFCMVCRKRFV